MNPTQLELACQPVTLTICKGTDLAPPRFTDAHGCGDAMHKPSLPAQGSFSPTRAGRGRMMDDGRVIGTGPAPCCLKEAKPTHRILPQTLLLDRL
jgi:hypothetical protein